MILEKENDLLLPFHREKAGGKNFLELLGISRNFSSILAASFVPIREKSAYLELELFHWFPCIKHRPPQLKL